MFAKRLLPLLLVACLCMGGLAGCGSQEEIPPPPPEIPEGPVEGIEELLDPLNPNGWTETNPLTGMPVETNMDAVRPVAVMLNNLKKALPQLGVSQADIIYEALAEGGITRMVGIFSDPAQVGDLGSVRSARPYYVELALAHDAILVHAGGSEQAYTDMADKNVTHLDGVRGTKEAKLFWRDQGRINSAGYEHSMLTSGQKLAELIPTYDLRLEHGSSYTYDMPFAMDGTPADGQTANTVTVKYSGAKSSLFEYDTEAAKYLVSEYGAPYVDGNNKEQVAVTNVLVLETQVSAIPGDTAGRLTTATTGGGSGYFACGGKVIPIRWERASSNDRFHYYEADGTELSLGRGNSYVNIVPEGSSVTFE